MAMAFPACSHSHEAEPSSLTSVKRVPCLATHRSGKARKGARISFTLQLGRTAAGNNSCIVLLVCSHHIRLPLQGVPASVCTTPLHVKHVPSVDTSSKTATRRGKSPVEPGHAHHFPALCALPVNQQRWLAPQPPQQRRAQVGPLPAVHVDDKGPARRVHRTTQEHDELPACTYICKQTNHQPLP